MKYLILLLTISCTPIPGWPPDLAPSDCYTHQLKIIDTTESWDCEEISNYVDRSLAIFESDLGWSMATMEKALSASVLRVRPNDSDSFWSDGQWGWEDKGGLFILGQTNCSPVSTSTSILIGHGSLKNNNTPAHELVHVIQDCSPADHGNWDELGIWQVLQKIGKN